MWYPEWAPKDSSERSDDRSREARLFEAVVRKIEDLVPRVEVAEPGVAYGFHCHVTPTVGRLDSSHELYRFESVDESECRLVLINTVHFLPGLTVKQMDEEVRRMSLACHNALVKLKVHAELGAATVSAIEAHQFS